MSDKESNVCYKSQVDALDLTVRMLDEGKVLVLPCDTIYGLCAKVGKTTMEALYALKERDQRKPFLQLATLEQAERLCEVPEDIKAVWPCQLTAIMRNRDGSGKTAIRVPDDPFLQNVLSRLGSPMYSTSVNMSGSASLTNMTDIIYAFNGKVDLFVVDGEMQGTVPSTLIDCTVRPYRILRSGGYDATSLIR